MHKLFSIFLFALAVAPAGAMPSDDKPTKKTFSQQDAKILKQKAAARKAKSKASGDGNDLGAPDSDTINHVIHANATPPSATVPKPDKKDAKDAEGKETPKPVRRDWQIITPEQEVKADELIKEILRKWNRTKLFSAKFKQERATGQVKSDEDRQKWEYVILTDTEGTYDLKRDGDKTFVRMEIQVGDSYQRVDDSQPRQYHVTNWYDGEYLYALKRWKTTYVAEKQDLRRGTMMAMGGEKFFEDLRRIYKLRVREPQKLGDRDALIIEGVTKLGEEKANLAIHWFDKESGVLLKLATYDHRRRPKQSITLEDLNLNPKFPAKHFTFAAPNGVRLRDLTKNASSATGG